MLLFVEGNLRAAAFCFLLFWISFLFTQSGVKMDFSALKDGSLINLQSEKKEAKSRTYLGILDFQVGHR